MRSSIASLDPIFDRRADIPLSKACYSGGMLQFRTLLRLALTGLSTLTLGYTWTVGQSGLASTNRNLCELWQSLGFANIETCTVQHWILILWTALAFIAMAYLIFEAARLLHWLWRWVKSRRVAAGPTSPDAAPRGATIVTREVDPDANSDWWLDRAVHEKAAANRVPLQEAARYAYEATEILPFGAFLRREHSQPEKQIDHIIRSILCATPPFELQGSRPPSTVSRTLNQSKQGHLNPVTGTSNLRKTGFASPLYFGVTISRADLARFIKALKELPADI